MMTIKNKNLIKYLIITIIAGAILIPASDVQAAPDTDTIKSWLQGKKIVVGKTLWLFDKTENIRVEKITSIRIIDYDFGDTEKFVENYMKPMLEKNFDSTIWSIIQFFSENIKKEVL